MLLEPAHTIFPLSSKELIEGVLMYIFGLVCGAKLTHKFVIKPARAHHKEQMEAHAKTHAYHEELKNDR